MGEIYEEIFGVSKRKKGINSKKKGDHNEREVAKWLKQWSGKEFHRVPASGGLRWKDMVETVGDLVCETDFPFVVETKHLKKVLALNKSGLLRSNSKIFRIWYQCLDEAKRSGKIPILILRENGMKKNTFWIVFSSLIFNEGKAGWTMPHYRGFSEEFSLSVVHSDLLLKFGYEKFILNLTCN